MIREDEIREFQEIIGTFQPDSEEEPVIENDAIEQQQESQDSIEVHVDVKPEIPNIKILFITGLFGLVFFLSVFFGTILYIYSNQIKEMKNQKTPKPSQNLKIPGIERLITDPYPEGPETKIKVWGVGTAIPPEPLIYDYSVIFDEPEKYFDKDEMEMYFVSEKK